MSVEPKVISRVHNQQMKVYPCLLPFNTAAYELWTPQTKKILIPHSPFPIPYSLFPIPHSPFPIPHSPFPIPHSPFPFSRMHEPSTSLEVEVTVC